MSVQNFSDIVILYCPPKVGSTSIASSIRFSANDKYFVFHTHSTKIVDIVTGGLIGNITIDTILNNTYNPITQTHRKVFLIDIYRPTIERRISEFFQDISAKHFNNYEENINDYDLNKITKRFNDIYPHIEHKDYYKEFYNIPESELLKPFDMNKKYMKYQVNNITYLKLRLCDFNEWENILSNELDTKIYMLSDYKSKDKKIGNLYKRFNDAYRIPYNYFRMIETCPQFNYYYTEIERNNYLNLWRNKITNNYVSFDKKEYDLYVKISEENQTFQKNLNNHYKDSGCKCDTCKIKRTDLLNKKITEFLSDDNIEIVHLYDDLYSAHVSLFICDNIITVNVVNY